jgi:arylsulfatase A-like enzyme
MTSDTRKKPNIIFLMADDLGYGDTGFNGNTIIKTVNLDAMAKEGIHLTRFYSIGPVCAPTRASCLTGRHYMRFGMMNVNIGKLPHQEITLARMCKAKGYVTGHFGKWHLGTLKKGVSPVRRGESSEESAPPWERDYDESFVSEINLATWNPMDPTGLDAKHSAPFWHNGKIATENLEGDNSKIIMDRAIPFIRKAAKEKISFMTTIWFHAPHSPVRAGEKYLKMYGDYKEGEQHYYGCITAMDEQIGRLRQELRELGIDRNTMIWFCSDNGPEGDGNPPPQYDPYQGANYGKTGGFRGRKRDLYNGGVCVPATVIWPGTLSAGQVVDLPCSTLDYLPTLCEVIGFDMPRERPLDGESLVPLLEGKMKERTKSIPFASNLRSPRAALIRGDFKLCTDFSETGEEDALYHLYKDPAEKDNLISKHPELAASMKQELRAWVESCRKSYNDGDYPEPYEKQGIFLKYK